MNLCHKVISIIFICTGPKNEKILSKKKDLIKFKKREKLRQTVIKILKAKITFQK